MRIFQTWTFRRHINMIIISMNTTVIVVKASTEGIIM